MSERRPYYVCRCCGTGGYGMLRCARCGSGLMDLLPGRGL